MSADSVNSNRPSPDSSVASFRTLVPSVNRTVLFSNTAFTAAPSNFFPMVVLRHTINDSRKRDCPIRMRPPMTLCST